MIKAKVIGGTDISVKRCGNDTVVAAEVLLLIKHLISPMDDNVKKQFLLMLPDVIK